MKLLVDRGVDVNTKDRNSQTILLGAVRLRLPHVVEFLIDNDADVDAKDKHGYTAVRMAENRHATGIVVYLKAHGSKQRVV